MRLEDAEAAWQARPVRRGRPTSLVLILARELASNLATSIYVTDSDGTLVYFNEPAERIGGRSFAEAGEMSIREWAELLRPRSVDGTAFPQTEMPGGIAFTRRRPAHARLRVTGLDGVEQEIATTAFPLFGPDEEFHGVMVIFWEQEGVTREQCPGEPSVPDGSATSGRGVRPRRTLAG